MLFHIIVDLLIEYPSGKISQRITQGYAPLAFCEVTIIRVNASLRKLTNLLHVGISDVQ